LNRKNAVIPAKAGIQLLILKENKPRLDSRLRGNDKQKLMNPNE
jgi:hypothetical protein